MTKSAEFRAAQSNKGVKGRSMELCKKRDISGPFRLASIADIEECPVRYAAVNRHDHINHAATAQRLRQFHVDLIQSRKLRLRARVIHRKGQAADCHADGAQ